MLTNLAVLPLHRPTWHPLRHHRRLMIQMHAYYALGAAAYGSNELSYRLDSDGFSD